MSAMVQQGSILGSGLSDDLHLQVSEKNKVDVEEVQKLQEGKILPCLKGEVTGYLIFREALAAL